MQGRKILLAITGSIAAYKSILLLRLLVKAGAEVKVIMTPAAQDFVSPLVLATLSKHEVLSGLATDAQWTNHVMLGRWADAIVVAPLSCNTLAKMANGLCDNLLLATYLSATCPVIAAPAMDEDMWKHPATFRNLETVQQHGVRIIPVNSGELASGLTGPGRMAEPEEIMNFLETFFVVKTPTDNKPLTGIKALVTAGPTYEPIDPVRFIGNHSSGKMGVAIANQLLAAGASVTLVLGPSAQQAQAGVQVIAVQTAEQMYQAVMERFAVVDIAVMAAAVADYRPAEPATEKIKKAVDTMQLELVKNPDILKACGQQKQPTQVLVGFALETNHAEENARMKLQSKNADLLILNLAGRKGEGFATDTNKVSIFEANGGLAHYDVMPKEEVAAIIVSHIIQKRNEKMEAVDAVAR
jgi:phosphopantothenoylcysteine decarboxylase / phosphopantothenate---cysteine ligase